MGEKFLVGYGTLLSRVSLGHTIGEDRARDRPMRPVLVRGLQRLFNLRPDHYATSSRLGRGGMENGAMNVVPAAGHAVNGLAFPVSGAELAWLDRREHEYERLTVAAYDFASGDLVGAAGIYSAGPDAPCVGSDPERLLPLWRDLVWARAAAYAVGPDFGEHFDRTTYLADGRTLVIDRYKGHLEPGRPPTPDEVAEVAPRASRVSRAGGGAGRGSVPDRCGSSRR